MRRGRGIATRAGTVLVLGSLVACAAGGSGAPDAAVDGGGLPPDGEGPPPDAGIDAMPDASPIDAMPVDVALSQSTSLAVLSNNSPGCFFSQTQPWSYESSYYRLFDLPALGYAGQVSIDHVDIGVQRADAPDGAQTVTLRLSTLSGAFQTGNLTLRGSIDVVVFDQLQSVLAIDFAPAVVIPAGSRLVVELFVADSTDTGNGEHNIFFVGSNMDPETAPSYVRAPGGDCNVAQPTTFADLAYPETHVVMQVAGTSP
jgi:hypothetical protein